MTDVTDVEASEACCTKDVDTDTDTITTQKSNGLRNCHDFWNLPHTLRYCMFFYFWSYFAQRAVTAGLTTIDVFLIDNGFDEDELALVKFVGFTPFVLKVFASWLNDMWRPPWPGSSWYLSGRRRPMIFYGSLMGTIGTVLFAVFNSFNPTLLSVLVFEFLAVGGVAVCDQSIDGHSVELVAQVPPEYVSEPLVKYTGRVTSTINGGFTLGFFFAILTVTQLGPAWSWYGAFLLLAVGSTVTAMLVIPLKDRVQVAPHRHHESATCHMVFQMLTARGLHQETFQFGRKVFLILSILGVCLGGIVSTAVPFSKRVNNISVQEEGYIMMAGNIGFGIGNVIGGVLVDTYGTYPVLLFALVTTAPMPMLILVSIRYGGVQITILTMLVSGFLVAPAAAVLMAVMYNNAVPQMPAFFIATTYSSFNIGLGLGTLALVVAKRAGYDIVYVGITVLFISSVVLVIHYLRNDAHMHIRSKSAVVTEKMTDEESFTDDHSSVGPIKCENDVTTAAADGSPGCEASAEDLKSTGPHHCALDEAEVEFAFDGSQLDKLNGQLATPIQNGAEECKQDSVPDVDGGSASPAPPEQKQPVRQLPRRFSL